MPAKSAPKTTTAKAAKATAPAPPSQSATPLTGLTGEDTKFAEKFIKTNWNGEDPTTRVSPRVRNLDVALFSGASLLDDCARSSNMRLLVLGFRFDVRQSFQGLVELMTTSLCCRDRELLQTWASYVDHVGQKKSSQAFWEANFYNDRFDEHMRLKQSLIHPSRHFTMDALKNSWHGVRTTLGPFGSSFDMIHNPTKDTSSIFGIASAM